MPKTKTSDDAKFITFVATAPLSLVQTTMDHARAVLAGRLKLTTTQPVRTRTVKPTMQQPDHGTFVVDLDRTA